MTQIAPSLPTGSAQDWFLSLSFPRVYQASSVHPRAWSRSGCWAGAWRAANRTELVDWGVHPRVHFIPRVRDENRRRKRAGCGLCISVCTIALLPTVVGVDLLLSHSQARNTVRGMGTFFTTLCFLHRSGNELPTSSSSFALTHLSAEGATSGSPSISTILVAESLPPPSLTPLPHHLEEGDLHQAS